MLTSGFTSRWINPCLWHDSMASIIFTYVVISLIYQVNRSTHFSDIEARKVLFKYIFLNEQVQEVASAHILQYLEMAVKNRSDRDPTYSEHSYYSLSKDDRGLESCIKAWLSTLPLPDWPLELRISKHPSPHGHDLPAPSEAYPFYEAARYVIRERH